MSPTRRTRLRGPRRTARAVIVSLILLGGAAPGLVDVPSVEGQGSAPAAVGEGSEERTAADPVLLTREIYAMGTRLEARAWASGREEVAEALEAAFGRIEASEELLSSWRQDSELSRLNRAPPGRAVRVSEELFALLEEARRLREATGGAFDPAVGALVDAWDLRGDGRNPSETEIGRARNASGMGCFRLDRDAGTVEPLCAGAWLDAGAFGKGAALRRAREALREVGVRGALLDFGGQLLAVGAPADGEAWGVGISHPSRRAVPVGRLALRDRSAATTSASERFVVVDGEIRGHVLDPRTGRPVQAWGSVTVVTEDPVRADALSTALFVMGPEEARRWARDRDGVGVLLLRETPDGLEPWWNRAMGTYLVE